LLHESSVLVIRPDQLAFLQLAGVAMSNRESTNLCTVPDRITVVEQRVDCIREELRKSVVCRLHSLAAAQQCLWLHWTEQQRHPDRVLDEL
jgi:hypothetical protein